jgi:hypothetical protein
MKKIVLTVLSVASFSIYTNVDAKDYYVGGSVGFSNLNSQRGTGMAVNGFIGSEFNKYLNLEADATYFAKGDYSVGDYSNGNFNKIGEISQFFLGGAVKGNLPITNRLDLYSKVGIGYTYASLTGTNNYNPTFTGYNDQSDAWFPTTLVGAGLNYKLTKDLSIQVEDMNYISNVGGNLLAVGLNFSFN